MQIPRGHYPIKMKQIVLDQFQGIHTEESGTATQLLVAENVGCSRFPFLTNRTHRKVVKEMTKPNGALWFKGKLYSVDGTRFMVDDSEKGTLSDGLKTLIEFNGKILIFPDLKAYDTASGTLTSFSAAGKNIQSACVHNNRVFGFDGANIFACKQGDYTKWDTFDGLNTDSWATDVAGAVEFKSIVSYQDHVVIQSGQNLFELWGTKPANFTLKEINKVGTVSNFIEHRSRLYFIGTDGLYEYTGGVPRKITLGVSGVFSDGVVGYAKNLVFFSAVHNGRRRVYTFDADKRLVFEELGIDPICFAYENEQGILFDRSGKVYRLEESANEPRIPWQIETRPIPLDGFRKTYGKMIDFEIEIRGGTKAEVMIKNEEGVYEFVGSLDPMISGYQRIPFMNRVERLQMKIKGTGDFVLKAVRIIGRGESKI